MPDQKPPNPNGKKGGKNTKKRLAEVLGKIDVNLYTPVTEFEIKTPEGTKRSRFADVAAVIGKKAVMLFQVGKTNAKGQPVTRERQAIADIEKASGIKVRFEDYEK